MKNIIKDFTNKVVRKPSRTLVVNFDQPIITEGFIGLLNTTQINNGSQFLVFDNIENSQVIFNKLKDANFKVRFAHYRIFFTMLGIEDTANYNDIKEQHINWITINSDADVLYYKQYKKKGIFSGCGDFTIDTKESMDKLLDKNLLKNYNFNNYNGIYYRYNKKTSLEQFNVL